MNPQKYMDTHTIYCDSGVASQSQIAECLKAAIEDAENILEYDTKCRFKINLLVNKDGEYFGYGYIWISSPEIYWMLLGRNPDGSERVEEYPDPDWKSPVLSKYGSINPELSQNMGKNNQNPVSTENKKWTQIVEEEDSLIQPMIKRILPPLVTLPGYEYDEGQLKHLEEEQKTEEKLKSEIPKMGHFEISRGYAMDAPPGTMKNRLCARNVPDWVPLVAFKSIFSFYSGNGQSVSKGNEGSLRPSNKGCVRPSNEDYPKVNFVNTKNAGRMVFITFDPNTKDAFFTLLMLKKTVIVNPSNPNQKVTLVFSHAFEKQ